MSVVRRCWHVVALWSPVGKRLTSPALASLLCDVFLCFCHFPFGVLDQVWVFDCMDS